MSLLAVLVVLAIGALEGCAAPESFDAGTREAAAPVTTVHRAPDATASQPPPARTERFPSPTPAALVFLTAQVSPVRSPSPAFPETPGPVGDHHDESVVRIPEGVCPDEIVGFDPITLRLGDRHFGAGQDGWRWILDNCQGLAHSGEVQHRADSTSLPPCGEEPPLTVSPLVPGDMASIVTLGNLNPSGHTFPTSHTYMMVPVSNGPAGSGPFGDGRTPARVQIWSPGRLHLENARVTSREVPGREPVPEYAFEFGICGSLRVTFGHVGPLSERFQAALDAVPQTCFEYATGGSTYHSCSYDRVSFTLEPGEFLGVTSGQSYALDFGAFDTSRPSAPFVSPAAYANEARFNVCPYSLYGAELKEMFVSKVEPGPEPGPDGVYCGGVAFDVAGTAQGNWYQPPGMAFPEDGNVALVPYVTRDPVQPVFSVGTALKGLATGVYRFGVRNEGLVNRAFDQVVADGQTYCYENLATGRGGFPVPGTILLARVEEGERLTIEARAADACGPGPWPFTESASTYGR